jgi:hypothetical protein
MRKVESVTCLLTAGVSLVGLYLGVEYNLGALVLWGSFAGVVTALVGVVAYL